jgi:hypothetical protein
LVHKILIAVKTYPTLSTKYEESVCTAGFTENGKFIRIYPITFRKLPYESQYKKYEWIDIDIQKNKSDFRPESFQPTSLDTKIRVISKVDTKSNWYERKKIILKKVYTNFKEIESQAKDKSIGTSLAVFKPTKIINFSWTSWGAEWDKKKLDKLNQLKLFETKHEIIRKLPYKFVYEFEDESGDTRRMLIEDWEVGALFWKCLKRKCGDETLALQDVKKKFYEEFPRTKDIYFFLGTTMLHHFKPRPFIIIGLFYPSKESPNLFSKN